MFPKDIQDFISQHLHLPIPEVTLKLSKKTAWPKDEIINQINGKQKVAKKFPFLQPIADFKFPSPRAFSQASSEKTARFKAKIVGKGRIADLSGGMGIDSYFFSKVATSVDYVEANETLFQQTIDNFVALGANNIKTHNTTAENFIKTASKYDLIYIDPDRRNKNKRLFLLQDCEPNVVEMLPILFEKTEKVLLKLSPILDLKSVLLQLPFVESVWVVAVKNDCKELLFKLNKNTTKKVEINCCNIEDSDTQTFTFDFEKEENTMVTYSEPLKFLYEPNVSINKAGAFKSIAAQFQLNKIAANTHLYTSEHFIENFPGKSLKVMDVQKTQAQKALAANVVSKNFPLKAEEVRKKYKITEAKSRFLYACRLQNNQKVFIHAERI